MRKKTIGLLFIASVATLVVGVVLFIMGLMGSTSVYDPQTGNNQLTSIGNLPLFITGIAFYALALVIFTVAWIGALINVARLQQWAWFVLLLIFSGICLIVYLFAGPEAPNVARDQPQSYSS